MFDFVGLWMFPALILLIVVGVPVAYSMLGVAFVFGLMRFGEAAAVSLFMTKTVETASNYVLGAIPLFIFMGAILEKSGVAGRLFDALYLWTRRLPGSLAISTMIMCTLFGGPMGIAGGVETLVGLLALPPMLRRGYDKGLISGTICAGGSLGTAIPPSITIVVLAPIADVSVGDLFAGTMVPGMLQAGMFLLYILIVCWIWPSLAPSALAEEEEANQPKFWEKVRITSMALLPTVVLIVTVIGTVLWGLATPTESAACGCVGSLALAAMYRGLNFKVFVEALYTTLSITALIMLIVLAGSIFSTIFYASGGMTGVQTLLDNFGITNWQAIVFIMVLAFLAGFVLDLISVTFILVPVAMPLLAASGVDPIWFCVLFLFILQTSYLSPPMAPSIFYLRAIAPPEIRLVDMYRGVVPFIALQVVTILLILAFPGMATWLPEVLYVK